MPQSNVYKTISNCYSDMSKSQKKIATYILENTYSAPFLTVGKLAKMSDVSEATVVRFATFLGYEGYNEFQQYMYDSVEKQLNTVERLQMSRDIYDDKEKGIYEVFEDDMTNIQMTMENLNLKDFEKAASYFLKANNIYIVASRSAVSLGSFLHYYLDIMFGNSKLIHSSETAFEQLYDLKDNDLVVGLSFARYTKATLDIVTHVKKREVPIIAITDSLLSPITQLATISLIASSKMPSFLDSFVAPLSIINALITYLGKQQTEPINKRLKDLEQMWDEHSIFYQQRTDFT